MQYRAYAYNIRGKEVQSKDHDNREDAARELMAEYPKLKSVNTSRVYEGRVTGSDIRSHGKTRFI
jgi:hypothetical protein